MPLIFRDVSTCAICNQVIKASDLVFSSWWGASVVFEPDLRRYEDAALHWNCYRTSSIRKRLIQNRFNEIVSNAQASPHLKFVKAIEPFCMLMVDETEGTVAVISIDISHGFKVNLDSWDETINDIDPLVYFSSKIEQDIWSEFLPVIRDKYPTKESILLAINTN